MAEATPALAGHACFVTDDDDVGTAELIRRIAVPYTIYQIVLSPDNHIYAVTPAEAVELLSKHADSRDERTCLDEAPLRSISNGPLFWS